MLNWRRFGKEWGKCEECWLAYKRGIQHENSLKCYKLGVPLSALKIPLDEFLKIVKDVPGKYGVFSFPLSMICKGVIIFYFDSKEEMLRFYEGIKDYLKDDIPSRERKFFEIFVNVDWLEGANWRRGCPEYDKFGDWREWP